jgi:ABC-type multidrug transport system fused ATPase/permease subunit
MRGRDALHPSALAGDPFWAFARVMLRRRGAVFLTLLLAALSALFLGVGILTVQPILDGLLRTGRTLADFARGTSARLQTVGISIPPGWIDALPADPFKGLVLVMGVLAGLTLIGAAVTVGYQYLALTVVNATVGSIRRRAFRSVLRAPLRTIQAMGTADAVSRIVKDADVLTNGLHVLLGKTALSALKGLAGFAAAFYFDWRVAGLALLITPILYTVVRKLGKRIRRASGSTMRTQGAMLGAAGESLRALRTVKAFGAEGHEAGRFGVLNRGLLNELNRLRTARALASPLTEAITMVALGIIALVAARSILADKLDPSNFILAIVSLGIAGASLKPVTYLVQDIQTSTPAADRLRELILLPPEPGREPGLPALARPSRQIVFDRVTLTHPGRDRPALRGVSLAIAHGERVAFVGPNGCGKTTLLSLVPRLYDPDRGRVLIDGVDVKGVSVRSLRAQIGVVSQETVLFPTSVRANIAYPTHAEDSAVVAAARAARADEFITLLPGRYDTPVAEQGTSLSGGQRQRIAIARALMRDPAILILDEATSMIDAESEAKINEALREFSNGRTCLIVAHRLSTVVSCDRIVVMDDGAVVDAGTHQELLARCELYRTLASHQTLS